MAWNPKERVPVSYHTAITFQEAMGGKLYVKERRGKTLTSDIGPLNTYEADIRCWTSKGHHFGRSRRGPPDQFFGSLWDGCPEMPPPSAPSGGSPLGTKAYSSIRSPFKKYHAPPEKYLRSLSPTELSPRFASTESLRINDPRFPKAAPQTGAGVGPGAYRDPPAVPAGLPLGPTTRRHEVLRRQLGRNHSGAHHNRIRKNAQLRAAFDAGIDPTRPLSTHPAEGFSSSRGGVKKTSFENTASSRFLKKIQKDDNFHDYLKKKGYEDDKDYIDQRCRELLGRGADEIHQSFTRRRTSTAVTKGPSQKHL